MLRRALELNPDYVPALMWSGFFHSSQGRIEEALAVLTRSLELDPLSPFTHTMAGNGFLAAGRSDLAIAAHEKALSMDPEFLVARRFVAAAYARAGRRDEAVKSFERVVELGRRGAVYVAELGLAYGVSGRTVEAESLLAELDARSSEEYVSPLCFADILLGLGRNDEAAEWLQKAYEARSPGLPVFSWPRSVSAWRPTKSSSITLAVSVCGPS